MILGGRNLLEAAPGNGAVRSLVGDRRILRGALVLIVLFDEQPVVLTFFSEAVALHAYERPVAVQLLTVKDEFQLSRAQAFVDVGHRLPRPLIPHHHRAPAILSLGDRAFEAAVFDGMVFHLDGQTLVRNYIAGAFRDGPALQNAAPAKAKVVMQARGRVLLHDERQL